MSEPSLNELRADYITLHTRSFDSFMTGRSLTSEQEHYGDRFDAALAAHDRQVKAEAWDEGYMRGMYPWSEDGQEEDPIPAYMSPPSWGQNSNPYRIESEARP